MSTLIDTLGRCTKIRFINGVMWTKKEFSINLTCDHCGKQIYSGWWNGWNLYCDSCFKEVK